MKVVVLSVACGDGSPEEVRAALDRIGFVAREIEESGATPHLFEIPDNATKYRVMVVGEGPVVQEDGPNGAAVRDVWGVQEDCCPVCFSDWKRAHTSWCERGMR